MAVIHRASLVLAILFSWRLLGFSQNCTGQPLIDTGPSVTVNGPTSVTITWTTTGYNSSSMVIYGDDNNTIGGPDYGSRWALEDQVRGVTRHSVTINNLDTAKRYDYGVQSRCFTSGVPDQLKAVWSRVNNFTTVTGTVAANTLMFALVGIIPVQDGTHNGFHATPGYGVVIPMHAESSVIPTIGYAISNSGINFTLTGSLLTNYSVSGVFAATSIRSTWSGGTVNCNQGGGNQWHVECAVDITIPSNVPTSGTACTNNSGAVDLENGLGCAYPLTLSAASRDSNCSRTWICATPSQTIWIIMQSLSFPTGTVGATTIPCLYESLKKAQGCQYNNRDDSNNNGKYFSWEGQIRKWGTYFGQWTSRYDISAQANWFYDGDWVLKQYGDFEGSTSPWYGYEQYILHEYRDHTIYPIVQESTAFLTLTQSGPARLNGNESCSAIFAANGNTVCGTIMVNIGSTDISRLISGLAAGQTFDCTNSTPGNTNFGHLLAADKTAKTITCETYAAPAPANGSTWTIHRELNNIPADSGSNSTTIICAGCDMNNLAPKQVCYSPTTVSPLSSMASARGATIASVNPSTNTITLNSPGISGFTTGSAFQCRRWVGALSIFFWPEGLYDQWSRRGDYISADTIMQLTGTQQYMDGDTPDAEREQSLQMEVCRHVLDIQNVIGTATAITPNINCTSSSFRQTYLDVLITMIDYEVNNGFGNGTTIDSFLTGLHAYALIEWLNDSVTAASGDPRIPYWIKQLADWMYVQGYQYSSIYPQYYHQFPYNIFDPHAGIPERTSYHLNNGLAVNYYYSEQGLMWPMYAWLYMKTGNGTIANSGGVSYGSAFVDMFRYGVVQAEDNWPDGCSCYLGKTLGQQGLWMFEAFTWMQGSAPPLPQRR